MNKLGVYIVCCKKDYYFAKIGIASIRYWNETVPVYLLKDLSQGYFDTSLTEKMFNVHIATADYKNLYAYIKLQPYISGLRERILLSDSDVVWLGDMAATLDKYTENIIVDGYSPELAEEEMNRWYFNTDRLYQYDALYRYPGFLFNSGFFACDTSIFQKEDFRHIIDWKDNPEFRVKNVFLCEDQGIINYLFSKKIARNEISFKSLPLQIWGHSEEAENYNLEDIKQKKDYPRVIHWFGRKIGLIGFFPGSRVLKFYENYYYSKLNYGSVRLALARLKRSLLNPHYFVYQSIKRIFYFFNGRGNDV
ncbi:MAG: glycosyltransferase [Puia sp.]|nr:glycosyltransferase [Puia sp.]